MTSGFARLHDLLVLSRTPPSLDPRPIPSHQATRWAPETPIFVQPFREVYAKWWAVEVRFDRPLTAKEARVLRLVFEGWDDG